MFYSGNVPVKNLVLFFVIFLGVDRINLTAVEIENINPNKRRLSTKETDKPKNKRRLSRTQIAKTIPPITNFFKLKKSATSEDTTVESNFSSTTSLSSHSRISIAEQSECNQSPKITFITVSNSLFTEKSIKIPLFPDLGAVAYIMEDDMGKFWTKFSIKESHQAYNCFNTHVAAEEWVLNLAKRTKKQLELRSSK